MPGRDRLTETSGRDLEGKDGKEGVCFEGCVARELVYVMEEMEAEDESGEEGKVDVESADEEG